jgi:denticleless
VRLTSPRVTIASHFLRLEPERLIFQPHNNGIFDIKWNLSDDLLATCSGDQTTRISCPTTTTILHNLRGHTGTVKSIAWDPTHHDILSTGGRDGSICVWDLRVAKQGRSGDNGTSIQSTKPVIVIYGAHETLVKGVGRKKKVPPLAKSVTGLVYPDAESHRLISSGSFDGYATSKSHIGV